MKVSQYYTTPFTDEQLRKLLAGEEILLKDVPGKNKKPYNVYLKPAGIEEYQYEKDGKMVTGWQFRYEKTYPKKQKAD